MGTAGRRGTRKSTAAPNTTSLSCRKCASRLRSATMRWNRRSRRSGQRRAPARSATVRFSSFRSSRRCASAPPRPATRLCDENSDARAALARAAVRWHNGTMIRSVIADAARADRTPPADPGFGVYVHWPFCLSKCPYCDFNSHVRGAAIDEGRYLAAFKAEIAHRAAIAPRRTVRSVFFGGGTPSLMRPETVQGIIDAIASAWRLDKDAEITLEANPTSVEAERFRGYRSAGVNRLSIGVQALNDFDLKALGRKHTVVEALAAVRLAGSLFPRFTFDLIYGRPGQSEAGWRRELAEALNYVGDHISLYRLTIEPGTDR